MCCKKNSETRRDHTRRLTDAVRAGFDIVYPREASDNAGTSDMEKRREDSASRHAV